MAELRITAGLNAELSAAEIEKDLLEKVEPKLQAKAPNVKIVAGLKPTETATQIQSDINKLIGQTKAPTIKVGIDVGNKNAVQNISAELKDVQVQAQQTASAVGKVTEAAQKAQNATNGAKSKGNYFYNNDEILKSIRIFNQEENAIGTLEAKFKELGATVSSVERANGSGFLKGFTVDVKSATGEIEKFNYVWKNVGTKEQPDYKFKLTNITAANAGIQKLQQSLDKVFSDYTQKLEQFKSTNHGLLSGLSEPIKNFESKLAGLKNGTATIDEVKNSFQALNAEAAKITANFSRQLSPTDAAIRNISKGEDTIRNLRMEIAGLNNAPKEINAELEKCANLLANVKRIEAEQGTTEKWSKAYKDWELSVDSLTSKIKTLKSYEESISTSISSLNTLQNSAVFKNNASNPEVVKAKADIKALIADYQNLKTQLQGTVTPEGLKQLEIELTTLNSRFKSATEGATSLQRSLANTNGVDKQRQQIELLIARLESIKKANPKAMKSYGSQIDGMLSELRSGNVDPNRFGQITRQVQVLQREIQLTDKAGKTLFQNWGEKIKKFTGWMSMTYAFSTLLRYIRSAITELKEIDTILTEISKTSDRTEASLRKLGETSFATASKYGQKASDYLLGIQEMSRAGFGEVESEKMAELSTLAQSAGAMTAELANQYLIATNAGYKFAGNADMLNSVLD